MIGMHFMASSAVLAASVYQSATSSACVMNHDVCRICRVHITNTNAGSLRRCVYTVCIHTKSRHPHKDTGTIDPIQKEIALEFLSFFNGYI